MRPHRAAACCGAVRPHAAAQRGSWTHANTCGMEELLPMPPGVSAQSGLKMKWSESTRRAPNPGDNSACEESEW
jgi:hypothetical protein